MNVFFVTAYLGEHPGRAKSADDFARALLAMHDRVVVVNSLTEDFGALVAPSLNR